MTTPEVSHGRGGAGNINPDDTKYVDGEIVREGAEGPHGDGAFSTGRGGAANIGDAAKPPTVRADKDVVPDVATRPSQEGDFHVGRGGAANVHLAPETQKQKEKEQQKPNLGLADKLKNKIFGAFKK
ncbi:hypothetical protein F4775DRAFT_547123 [Biscogniauxia sp. FL1348]|nr:hypothetical protein F4775DRAFT_547123 [Biscogniauxia sp. FL1348]